MKKYTDYILFGFILFVFLLLVVVVGILLSPFIIFYILKTTISSFANDREYRKFLQTINKTKFFCYNSKNNTHKFVSQNLVGALPPDIKFVYLEGRIPKSDYNQEHISTMMYSIKERKGFPYLIEIVNGEIVEKSINNEFYNTVNQDKEIALLINTINNFFESNKQLHA